MSKVKCKCDETRVTRNYYRYYDTPDGCDVQKKMMVTTRYGVTVGMILGAYDVMMYSHAVGLGNVVRRFMMHTVPLGLMGATFAAVANGAQAIREEDDELNYFLGGFACGPILAAYTGSKHMILVGGLAMGVAGMIKKHAVENCWTFFPDITHHMGSVRNWRKDYTIVADPRDGGLVIGVKGMIKKQAVDNCWTFFPDITYHMGSVRKWRKDYTIVADPRDEMIHTCKPNK